MIVDGIGKEACVDEVPDASSILCSVSVKFGEVRFSWMGDIEEVGFKFLELLLHCGVGGWGELGRTPAGLDRVG